MAQLNINALAEMMSQTAGQTIGGVSRGIKQQKATTAATEEATALSQFQRQQKEEEAERLKALQEKNTNKRAALHPYLLVHGLLDGTFDEDVNGDGVVNNDDIAAAAEKTWTAELGNPSIMDTTKATTQAALRALQEGKQTGDYSNFFKKASMAQKEIDGLAQMDDFKDLSGFTSEASRKKMEEQRARTEEARTAKEFEASQAAGDIRTVGNNIVRVKDDGSTDTLFDGSGSPGGGYVMYDEAGNVQGTGSLEDLSSQVQPGWQLSKPPTIDPTKMGQSGEKPPTSGQRVAATYATRVTDANQVIEDVGAQRVGTFDQINLAPERFKSEEARRYNQAARNFINAVLRRESGAVIGDSEFENAQLQYLPQPGDSDTVLEQKRLNRLVVQAGLSAEAGDAAMEELQVKLEESMQDSSKVMVNGNLMSVGDQVTGANGQIGIVQADGTIKVVQ